MGTITWWSKCCRGCFTLFKKSLWLWTFAYSFQGALCHGFKHIYCWWSLHKVTGLFLLSVLVGLIDGLVVGGSGSLLGVWAGGAQDRCVPLACLCVKLLSRGSEPGTPGGRSLHGWALCALCSLCASAGGCGGVTSRTVPSVGSGMKYSVWSSTHQETHSHSIDMLIPSG